ncbi:DUF998 domain-containing protein [Halostella sp. JP-L12]|uniref:DUF998 domain-containing protein n=1 Tax=Halostella TaxID=1843185 RepID=UPI000EF78C1F|nr:MULTISPECIES: DUF998 domain-containing protein [Halostella]NHN48890.1 DUF998 domain-containing protein [Halostella sp. JP-L12]
MTETRRIAAATGLASAALALGGILVATLVSSSFTWAGAALSDMGRPGTGTYWLFNGVLIAAGALGVPFAYALLADAGNLVQRVGVGLFLVTVAAMAMVGVFHLPKAGHGVVAVTHYVGATLFLWVWGTGEALAGRVRRGLATVWLANAHVLAWATWVGSVAPRWFAAAEYAGALAFGGWVVVTARRLLGDSARAAA